MNKVKWRSAAFTLVELLVVISIISMLMAILMPALSNARQSGHRVVCMSNIRQLSLAWDFFANDHNGQLVSPEPWLVTPENRWVCDGPTSQTH